MALGLGNGHEKAPPVWVTGYASRMTIPREDKSMVWVYVTDDPEKVGLSGYTNISSADLYFIETDPNDDLADDFLESMPRAELAEYARTHGKPSRHVFRPEFSYES